MSKTVDYQTKGYTQFGADMGRRNTLATDSSAVLQLRPVPIDASGYDPGGAYWGSPGDLYHVTDAAEGLDFYARAKSAEEVRAMFPQATWAEEPSEATAEDLADMLGGYIGAALWSTDDPDHGGKTLDAHYTEADLSDECRASMKADCDSFAKENATALRHCLGSKGPYGRREVSWDLIGYHLWMRRSGSGVGFQDGDYLEPEDKALDSAAGKMGEVNLYSGDDGKIYSH